MLRYLLILIFCLIPFIGYTTETIKISELGDATSATGDDYLVMVNDPGGSPVTKKITATNLFQNLPALGFTGCGSGVVYSTADAFTCETSLPSVTISGFTVSRGMCSDASGNATTCTTQPMVGSIAIITKADSYTLGTDDAREAYGYMVFMSGDTKILTLPAVAAGMNFCLYSTDATEKRIDPNASDGIRNGTAARNADGHYMKSDASAGAFACLIGDSADGWTVLGKSGTWSDE